MRLEALTHDSLPNHGPGRSPTGLFAQISWNVTAAPPDRKDPITLEFDNAWADHQFDAYRFRQRRTLEYRRAVAHGKNAYRGLVDVKARSPRRGYDVDLRDAMPDVARHRRKPRPFPPVGVERPCRDRAVQPKLLAVTKLTDPWEKLAAAYQLKGDQQAIDRLVERRPKLAGPVGDLFTQEPNQNWQRAVEIYNKGITAAKDEAGRMKDEGKRQDASDSSFILHPPSLLSKRAQRLRGAEELGGRRGRLVAGRERKPGRGQIARRVRPTTCCRRPGFRWRRLSSISPKHFTTDLLRGGP